MRSHNQTESPRSDARWRDKVTGKRIFTHIHCNRHYCSANRKGKCYHNRLAWIRKSKLGVCIVDGCYLPERDGVQLAYA